MAGNLLRANFEINSLALNPKFISNCILFEYCDFVDSCAIFSAF